MLEPEVEKSKSEADARRMKQDWDSRAIENAKWYINTIGVDQSDEEFFASGLDELREWWLPDFRAAFPDRDLSTLRVFEMGCGIGRMTSHLADVFGEVWAVDVSGEMIAQAKSRFGYLRNVRWIETGAIDLPELPNDFFDLGFSIYVYQHMPGKEAIAANIAAAFRKLKQGGLYKFHTNGIENSEYEAIEKDTWVGAAFPEGSIRALARQLGGQLLSIQGAGTQYCWTTLRKQHQSSIDRPAASKLEIRYAGLPDRAESRIPVEGDNARICVVAAGLDRERVDCNTITLFIEGVPAMPAYAGSLSLKHTTLLRGKAVSSDLVVIEVEIPSGVVPGKASVSIEWNKSRSNSREVEFVPGAGLRPKIVTIRNGADFGTDVYCDGPKSLLNLYVAGLDDRATVESVSLELSGSSIRPHFVGFVRENGTWQVNAQLPQGTEAGTFDLVLRFDGRVSDPVQLRVR